MSTRGNGALSDVAEVVMTTSPGAPSAGVVVLCGYGGTFGWCSWWPTATVVERLRATADAIATDQGLAIAPPRAPGSPTLARSTGGPVFAEWTGTEGRVYNFAAVLPTWEEWLGAVRLGAGTRAYELVNS
jgi:hypothetical protein